jgi:fumarate hydratase class I
MPVTVAVDHTGESIHQTGPRIWAEKISQRVVNFDVGK